MRTLITIIIILLIGLGLGYYFGYDWGYEKAVKSDIPEDEHKGLWDDKDYRVSAAASSALVGVWQSNEDANFTREFNKDGSAYDKYEGETDQGVLGWSLFTKEEPDTDFAGEFEDGAVYMRMTNGSESLYFKIIKVTPEELELVYLDRGNILSFKKID